MIFSTTLVLVVLLFHDGTRWSLKLGIRLFHYFTLQSNVFCAAAALLRCIAPEAHWVWVLKYVGTAAVTVTMMTVLVFLAPAVGSVRKLTRGNDFFMHLATPLTAILCFTVFEKQGLRFGTAMLGMLPVLLYGPLYLYKILFAPPEKRWDDFYGFNKQGKWPVAFAAMVAGTFAICMGIMALQNL